ncbi:MAG: response regulator transcription factor [Chitinophagaceae bacterium]|nr:response regulator transcription factor [Chitinophagaceae bacterium]
MKLLIIEDEKELAGLLAESLAREQFVVESAGDFDTAMEKLGVYNYDCILLDIGLPDGNGLDILRQLKEEGKSENVIIISARDSLDDKLAGLDLGADDYLTKPFHIAELNARVKAVLRRKETDGKHLLEFGNLTLDLKERQAFVKDNNLQLNRKEFDILNYFLLNKTRLVTKTALAEHVWGDNIDQADNFDFIYYQMKNLRKKLRDNDAGIEIESVYGVGYRSIEK